MSRYTPNQPLSRPFPKILARLRGVKRTGPAAWMAICPAHADHDPSLSVRLAEDGRTLLHCFAGCALASIISAVEMTVADLSPDRPLGLPGGPRPHADPRGNGAPPAPPTSPVRGPQEPLRRDPFAESRGVPGEDLGDEGGGVVFTYRLMDGRLAPRHHRRKFLHEPKGWTWTGTKEDGDLVPYGLWKLDMAREQDQLLLVEGETDTLTAWHHGIPALGLPGADMAGLLRAEYLQGFSRIFVVQESDHGGEIFVRGVAARLRELAWPGVTKVIVMPAGCKDLNDLHVRDQHDFPRQVLAVMGAARPIDEVVRELEAGPFEQGFKWLDALLAQPDEPLDWLVDQVLLRGSVSLLVAKPKAGKSTLARVLADSVDRLGSWLRWDTKPGTVWYIAPEEKESEVKRHFRAMGARGANIRVFTGPVPEHFLPELRMLAERDRPDLIILDGLFRFVRVADGNDYVSVQRALEPLLSLARDTGVHVLVIHHLRKGDVGEDSTLGSTAIDGTFDTILVLMRKGHKRTLTIRQRYGEDIEPFVLQMDPVTRVLTAGANVEAAASEEAGRAIEECLAKAGAQGMQRADLLKAAGGNQAIAGRTLGDMVEGGQVSRTKVGRRVMYTMANGVD